MPAAIDWKSLLEELVTTIGPELLDFLLNLLAKSPSVEAFVAAFDWRALVSQILQALLAWLNPPALAAA